MIKYHSRLDVCFSFALDREVYTAEFAAASEIDHASCSTPKFERCISTGGKCSQTKITRIDAQSKGTSSVPIDRWDQRRQNTLSLLTTDTYIPFLQSF
jgi:hypothetical protein